jgi:hypothetical protein
MYDVVLLSSERFGLNRSGAIIPSADFRSARCFRKSTGFKTIRAVWWRFVGDIPQPLRFPQFLFGLVPELIFPTFGLPGLLPKLMD